MAENLIKTAQAYFIEGDFDTAKTFYSKLNMPLELAYCEIFTNHVNIAKKIISKMQKDSPAAEWIVAFVQMLEANLKFYPSYLQIRNFFEIDFNNLFLYGTKEQVENVINYVPVLANVNGEIYKLAARVLKNNEQDELAKKFLEKSLDIYFNDPETHFMLAELFYKYQNYEKAKKHLLYACQSGRYFPAERLLNKISNLS